MQPVIANPGCCQFRLPFVEADSSHGRPQESYCQMLSYYFSPYFRVRSWSFLFIVVTFLCMVIPQFLFPSMNSTAKLFSYTLIPGVYLNPIQVKHINHWNIYKCFTTMFFHMNYTHWLGNLLGITVNLFTMEFCWNPSIILMLLGGTVTCAYAVLAMNNMLMGFSGVIACSVGLYIGMFIGNWTHIRTHYSRMMTTWFMNCIFIFFLLFSNDPRSTMVHFIALFIGIIYGLAWIPKLAPDACENLTGVICKILSVLITLAPFIIIFMHPQRGGQMNDFLGSFTNTGIPGYPGQQPNMYNFQQQQGMQDYGKQPSLFQQFMQPFQQTNMNQGEGFKQFQPQSQQQWF